MVQEAMAIIRSNSVLKIEEVIELFNNTTEKVNEMKEHLCAVLDSYQEKINTMRKQIDTQSHQTCKLRNKRRHRRNKLMSVKPSKSCDICFHKALKIKRGETLNDEPPNVSALLIFPCNHVFHRECVRAYMQDYQTKNPKI